MLDGLPESFRAAISDDDVEALSGAATDPDIYAKIIKPVVDAFAGLPKGLALTAAEANPKAGAARWEATALQWMAYHKAKPSELVKAVARMVHELVQALTSWNVSPNHCTIRISHAASSHGARPRRSYESAHGPFFSIGPACGFWCRRLSWTASVRWMWNTMLEIMAQTRTSPNRQQPSRRAPATALPLL